MNGDSHQINSESHWSHVQWVSHQAPHPRSSVVATSVNSMTGGLRGVDLGPSSIFLEKTLPHMAVSFHFCCNADMPIGFQACNQIIHLLHEGASVWYHPGDEIKAAC